MHLLIPDPYESLRMWALHPSLDRPPGLAPLLRFGMASWIAFLQAAEPPISRYTPHQREGAMSPHPGDLIRGLVSLLRKGVR
jgi:hypothetical protein